MKNDKQILYRLRKSIGFLGLLLPTILMIIHLKILNSISHYYYTSSGIFFIGILFAFGLILISYKGYDLEEDERVSDDFMTSIAGIFALLTVIIPTSCYDSGDTTINCDTKYLFGHTSVIFNTVHLICAGIFLFILGWMCIYKFTRGKTEEGKKHHKLYKTCGFIVWACIGLILLIMVLNCMKLLEVKKYIPNYVFILESIALYAFAVAWLIKGNIDQNISSFLKKS